MSTEFNLQIHTLDNGLRVALESLPHLHSASVGVWMNTGSANERAEESGVSHFLEHLLFKGTESRSASELMAAIEGKGGHMNGFTSRDYTCLYVKALAEHVGSAVDILGDAVCHSTYHDFEKERGVILEEIVSSIDVPDEHIHDLLSEKLWPEQAIGWPIAGSVDTVSALGIEGVRAYQNH